MSIALTGSCWFPKVQANSNCGPALGPKLVKVLAMKLLCSGVVCLLISRVCHQFMVDPMGRSWGRHSRLAAWPRCTTSCIWTQPLGRIPERASWFQQSLWQTFVEWMRMIRRSCGILDADVQKAIDWLEVWSAWAKWWQKSVWCTGVVCGSHMYLGSGCVGGGLEVHLALFEGRFRWAGWGGSATESACRSADREALSACGLWHQQSGLRHVLSCLWHQLTGDWRGSSWCFQSLGRWCFLCFSWHCVCLLSPFSVTRKLLATSPVQIESPATCRRNATSPRGKAQKQLNSDFHSGLVSYWTVQSIKTFVESCSKQLGSNFQEL